MTSSSFVDAVAAAVATITFALWLRYQYYPKLPLPPGPPRLPILGNVFDLVTEGAAQAYLKMGEKLGSDVICLQVMGIHLVILNSREAAIDLLEKRSNIYSDRPWMTMLSELIGLGWSLPLLPYGEDWKLSRKMFHHELGLGSTAKYGRLQEEEICVFLSKLSHEPERFLEHIRHLSGAIIVRVAYGLDVQAHSDPYVRLAEEAMRGPSKAATPGSYLVDTLPMLKYVPAWFPGAGFKKAAAESRKSLDALLHTPYEDLRRHMREGKTPDCAATSLLEAFGNTPEIETAIKKTLATMYIAGADTSVSTLSTFFLAMVLYPDIQAKAQDELDTILDGSRLPDLSDRASMPYITSIMKEALRWKPVVSLNLPRRLTQDDMYRGYRIPEGSLMCSNDWAIMHDESVFPSPSVFNPDRFMKDGALNTEVQDPTTIAFGFGRRICPGRYIAQDMLWISIASVLTIFNISMEMNKDGKKVMPETGSLPGFLSHPKPFRCTIKPRSDSHVSLLGITVSDP